MREIRSTPQGRARAADVLRALLPGVTERASALHGAVEGAAFAARLEHLYLDLIEPLDVLYGAGARTPVADAASRPDLAELVGELLVAALDAWAVRPDPLRVLDRRREIDPGWFQRARMLGYVCYVDRFAGTLNGVAERLDYLSELGVTYLHLMPLLRPREGENDGGYAVTDYDAVDPRLGTMGDLEKLAEALHERGMSVCVDLVLNHTADDHAWARAAAAGDPAYKDFYFTFADRTLPDAYERTLPEVFPDLAPGSFTHVPAMGGWVWTTFNAYQWDLDYTNPRVFAAMVGTMLRLANRGVDVLRLDAVPFLWKRMGTNCQNQPEVHLLVQAFRALMRLAAPGVSFKAEAIVAPEELVGYLGAHDRYRPECDLAYNNQLMVMLWSSLATRDGRLMTASMSRLRPEPAPTSWCTYLRCHDDIGWAVSDADARSVGWDGYAHRHFLNAFFSGRFPSSYARGALFQENPATGDARISGSAAALCGIEDALERADAAALDAAVRRLLLMYSVVFSYGGIPLLYMGDELALGNDPHWAEDPEQAGDNRWMHRPPMDWAAAERRFDPTSLEGRVYDGMRRLAAARRSQLALRAGGRTTPYWTDNPHVFAYRRRHPRSADFFAVCNFAESPQSIDAGLLAAADIHYPQLVHAGEGGSDVVDLHHGRLQVPALGFVWIADS